MSNLKNQSNHQELIAILRNAHLLKEGEFVFRLHDNIISGTITDFSVSMRVDNLTEFEMRGYIK